MNVSPEQVCAAVSKVSIDDITVDDLGLLRGMATAIKDGETTVDEAFPKIDPKKPVTPSDKQKAAESTVKPDGKTQDTPLSAKQQLLAAIPEAKSESELDDIMDHLRDRLEERVVTEVEYEQVNAEVSRKRAALKAV